MKIGNLDIKIDNLATDGLVGTENSLAYRTEKIEKHFHSFEKWLGAAAVPSGETHIADRLGPSISPFALTSGNDAFGSWVQILGSSDTPVQTGVVSFDAHRILVTTTTSTEAFVIQMASGESAGLAAKITAEAFTEVPYIAATNNADSGTIDVMIPAIAAGTKLWARCICIGQDAKVINFYFGIHEYLG